MGKNIRRRASQPPFLKDLSLPTFRALALTLKLYKDRFYLQLRTCVQPSPVRNSGRSLNLALPSLVINEEPSAWLMSLLLSHSVLREYYRKPSHPGRV